MAQHRRSIRARTTGAAALWIFAAAFLTAHAQLSQPEGYERWKGGSTPRADASAVLHERREFTSAARVVFDDNSWSDRFGRPGIDAASVRAIARGADGRFYVGGDFTVAGGVRARNIASWDPATATWASLGSGFDGPVNGLVWAPSGLYAVGAFRRSGSLTLNGVAHWNGVSWEALGSVKMGVAGAVYTITAVGADSILVGGAFNEADGVLARNVAVWNSAGRVWSGLTGTLSHTHGPAYAAHLLYDSVLYVAGSFTHAGGKSAANIAAYDFRRGAWEPLSDASGNGVPNVVTLLAEDTSSSRIVVGGAFQSATPPAQSNLLEWNPAQRTWHAPTPHVTEIPVAFSSHPTRMLATAADERGDASRLYRFDGAWQQFGRRMPGLVEAIVPLSDGTFLCGGSFLSMEGMPAATLAHVDAGGSAPVSRTDFRGGVWASANAFVDAIARIGDDVYVAGAFRSADTVITNNIARWNRTTKTWSALGPDTARGVYGEVYTLRSSGSDLYVGGFFFAAGPTDAQHIARWDARAGEWSRLGPASIAHPNGAVTALAVDRDLLFAAGAFSTVDTFSVLGLSAWNMRTFSWQAADLGLKYLYRSATIDAIDADDSVLYVTGFFEPLAGIAYTALARYEKQAWRIMTRGISGTVAALRVDGDNVYIGGEFTDIDNVPANNVASWNRTTLRFSALGEGIDGPVRTLAARDGRVFAAGEFTQAGVDPASNIARWNGWKWQALGSGTDAPVLSLDVEAHSVFAGGSFTQAGAKTSLHLGEWDDKALGIPDVVPAAHGLVLRAYPNPAREQTRLLVSAPEGPILEVALYSPLGVRIARMDGVAVTRDGRADCLVPLRGLAAGVYVLRVTTRGHSASTLLLVE